MADPKTTAMPVINLDLIRKERAGAVFNSLTVTASSTEAVDPPVKETWTSRLISFGWSNSKAREQFITLRAASLHGLVNEIRDNTDYKTAIEMLETEVTRLWQERAERGL